MLLHGCCVNTVVSVMLVITVSGFPLLDVANPGVVGLTMLPMNCNKMPFANDSFGNQKAEAVELFRSLYGAHSEESLA
jgi:hypothetical protein